MLLVGQFSLLPRLNIWNYHLPIKQFAELKPSLLVLSMRSLSPASFTTSDIRLTRDCLSCPKSVGLDELWNCDKWSFVSAGQSYGGLRLCIQMSPTYPRFNILRKMLILAEHGPEDVFKLINPCKSEWSLHIHNLLLSWALKVLIQKVTILGLVVLYTFLSVIVVPAFIVHMSLSLLLMLSILSTGTRWWLSLISLQWLLIAVRSTWSANCKIPMW